MKVRDESMPRLEIACIVVLTAQGRGLSGSPLCTRTPGFHLNPPTHLSQMNHRRAFRGSGRAPRVAAVDAKRWTEPDRGKC